MLKLIIGILVLFCGCEQSQITTPSIVGVWEMGVQDQPPYGQIAFSSDGTYSMSGCVGWGDWSMEGDKLKCAFGGPHEHYWSLKWSHGGNVVRGQWDKEGDEPKPWLNFTLRRIR